MSRVLCSSARMRLNDFRESLVGDHACPWPRLSVRVDPMLWNGSPTLDEILAEADGLRPIRNFESLPSSFNLPFTTTPQSIASQLESGRPLKVLGITSDSRLSCNIPCGLAGGVPASGPSDAADYRRARPRGRNSLTIASAARNFKPDLVVIIDHHSEELGGVPEHVPLVMWVQDALPRIFRREAGAAQGGSITRWDFPGSIWFINVVIQPIGFMSAMIGCDEMRFAPRPLSPIRAGGIRLRCFVREPCLDSGGCFAENGNRSGRIARGGKSFAGDL